MSDPFKPTDEQKDEVRKAILFWRNVLFLSHYRINQEYDAYDESDGETRAKCEPNSIYKFAKITFMPLFFRDTKEAQDGSVLHELLHIVLQPLGTLYQYLLEGKLVTKLQYHDAIEEVTVHLTTAIQKLEEERQSEIVALRDEIARLKSEKAASQTA